MEHAQRDTLIKNESVVYGSLNPYFNGTCSKSKPYNYAIIRVHAVLILILMEHAQRAKTVHYEIERFYEVLILILMEHVQRGHFL